MEQAARRGGYMEQDIRFYKLLLMPFAYNNRVWNNTIYLTNIVSVLGKALF